MTTGNIDDIFAEIEKQYATEYMMGGAYVGYGSQYQPFYDKLLSGTPQLLNFQEMKYLGFDLTESGLDTPEQWSGWYDPALGVINDLVSPAGVRQSIDMWNNELQSKYQAEVDAYNAAAQAEVDAYNAQIQADYDKLVASLSDFEVDGGYDIQGIYNSELFAPKELAQMFGLSPTDLVTLQRNKPAPEPEYAPGSWGSILTTFNKSIGDLYNKYVNNTFVGDIVETAVNVFGSPVNMEKRPDYIQLMDLYDQYGTGITTSKYGEVPTADRDRSVSLKNYLLTLDGFNREQRINIIGEDILDSTLDTSKWEAFYGLADTPTIALDKIAQMAIEDTENFINLMKDIPDTKLSRGILLAAMPGLEPQDLENIFGTAKSLVLNDNVQIQMENGHDYFTNNEIDAGMNWIVQNKATFMERLAEASRDGVPYWAANLMSYVYGVDAGTGRNYLEQYEKDTRSAWEKFGDSIVLGYGDIAASLGGGIDWLGDLAGIKEIEEIGEELGKTGQAIYTNVDAIDGTGWQFVRMLPTQIALMTVSLGTANTVGAIAQTTGVTGGLMSGLNAVPVLSKIAPYSGSIIEATGAGTVSRGIESLMEAGSAYQQAISSGMSKEEASRMARNIFTRNMQLVGLDIGQFAIAFVPQLGNLAEGLIGKGLVKSIGGVTNTLGGEIAIKAVKLGSVSLSEAGEEYYQQIIQMQEQGEDISAIAIATNLTIPEIQQVVILGAISGGLFEAGGEIMNMMNGLAIQNLPQNMVQFTLDKTAEYLRQGFSLSDATVASLNSLGDRIDIKPVAVKVAQAADIQIRASQIVTSDPVVAQRIQSNLQAEQDLIGLQGLPPVVIQTVPSPSLSAILGAESREGAVFFNQAEVKIANDTSRSRGAVGANAITPKYVAQTATPNETILDYGAGKDAMHTQSLQEQGLNVTAHEIGENYTPGVHDPSALTKQYDTVYASNVLNVAPSAQFLNGQLSEISQSTADNGRAVFNYPATPRKAGLTVAEVKAIISQYFSDVKRVGGTSSAPVWEARNPIRKGTGAVSPSLAVQQGVKNELQAEGNVPSETANFENEPEFEPATYDSETLTEEAFTTPKMKDLWHQLDVKPKQLKQTIAEQRGQKIDKQHPVRASELDRALRTMNKSKETIKLVMKDIIDEQLTMKAIEGRARLTELRGRLNAKIVKITEEAKAKAYTLARQNAAKAQEIAQRRHDLRRFVNDYLPPEIRGKLNTAIDNVKTVRDYNNAVYRVAQLHEKYYRKALTNEIRVTLKKGIKSNTDADTNTLLKEIKDPTNFKTDHEESRRGIARNLQLVEEGLLTQEEADNTNEALRLTNFRGMDTEELQYALDKIEFMIEEGKQKRNSYLESQALIRERNNIVVNDEINSTKKGKFLEVGPVDLLQFKPIAKVATWVNQLYVKNVNFYRILNNLGQRAGKEAYKGFAYTYAATKIHQADLAAKRGRAEMFAKARQALGNIYGTHKAGKLNKILNGHEQTVDFGEVKWKDGTRKSFKLTVAQMMKAYQYMMDPTVEPLLTNDTNNWTSEMKMMVVDKLTVEEKAWAEYQMAFYQEYWQTIDAVYSRVTGEHLGYNPFYTPLSREENVNEKASELDLMKDDLYYYKSVKNKSLIARVPNDRVIRFNSANSDFINHITQMEHYKAWQEPLSDLLHVFNKTTMANIEEVYGKEVKDRIDEYFEMLARGGIQETRMMKDTNRILNGARSNFTTAILGAKPLISIKQLFSGFAYMTQMPVGDYVKYTADFWNQTTGNSLDKYRILKEKSTYLQLRIGEGFERDIKYVHQSGKYTQLSGKTKLRDYVLWHIKGMDRVAVVQGMWAVYQSNLKLLENDVKAKKITQEQADAMAIERAELATEMTQPTSSIQSMAFYQNASALTKMATMFQNQPSKYFGIITDAMLSMRYARENPAKAMTNMALAWVILPAMFQLVSDGFRWDEDHLKRVLYLGPVNDILVVGQLAQSAYGWYTDEQFDYNISPVLGVIDDLMSAIAEGRDLADDVTMDNFIKFMEEFGDFFGKATGIPTPYMKQVEQAIRDGQAFRWPPNKSELIWSRWAIDASTTKTQAERDAETEARHDENYDNARSEVWNTTSPEKLIGDLRYIAETKGITYLRQVINQNYDMTPEELLAKAKANNDPVLENYAQQMIYEDQYNVLPDVALIDLNADEAEGYTYEDYFMQWQTLKSLSSPLAVALRLPYENMYPDAYKGNFSQDTLTLLQKYWDLPEDKRADFIKLHPELAMSPREAFLRNNTDANASMFLWGQTSKLYDLKAYNAFIAMKKELDITDAMLKYSYPPENVAPAYFEYNDMISSGIVGNSAEAQLFRLDHPELNEWGMVAGNMSPEGWKEIDTPREKLEITVADRDIQALYDEAEDKHQFLADNPTFREHQFILDFYKDEVPWDRRDDYLGYKETVFQYGATSAKAMLYRLDHPELDAWGRKSEEDGGKGWEMVSQRREVLEIIDKWAPLQEELDELWATAPDQQTYDQEYAIKMLQNPEYQADMWRKDAYQMDEVKFGAGYSESQFVEDYVEWMKSGYSKSSALGEAWLRNHPDFFNAIRYEKKWGYLEGDPDKLDLMYEFADQFQEADNLKYTAGSIEEEREKLQNLFDTVPGFEDAYYMREGYDEGLNKDQVGTYAEFAKTGFTAGSKQGRNWFFEHWDWYQDVARTMGWDEELEYHPPNPHEYGTKNYDWYEDAYRMGIADKWVDTYIEWKNTGLRKGTVEGDAWLWEHYDFYEQCADALGWGELKEHTRKETNPYDKDSQRYEYDAWNLGIPDEWWDTYIAWRKSGYTKGTIQGDRWLQNHPGFYEACAELIGWTGGLSSGVGYGYSGGLKGATYIPK